jgi:Suv3 C-terminal domain 1
MIEDINLDLIDRYTFATCPINLKQSFKLSKRSFLSMVTKFSMGEEIPYPGEVLELMYNLRPTEDETMG